MVLAGRQYFEAKQEMAFSISCCHNLTPPPSSISESLHSSGYLLARPNSEKLRSRNYGCLLGAATLMVGLQMICSDGIMDNQAAFASEMNNVTTRSSSVESNSKRWSDKRRCPSWRVNSLETIVPENLPRPFAHRRSEAVEFPNPLASTNIVTVSNKCFSL